MRFAFAVALAALLLTGSGVAAQEPYVAVIGCSNSRLIGDAYLSYSSRDAAWNAAAGGYALSTWATETGWTVPSPSGISYPPFDEQLAQRGQPSSVWYPLCVRTGDYRGSTAKRQRAAWTDFLSFYSLLRDRTPAPLWLTDKLAEQPACTGDDREMQTYVVDRAVSEGYASRSLPDMPPASVPHGDCHFDPVLSTNVGAAAAQFIDG